MPDDVVSTRDFVLPDLGEGLEDAVLVEWHVEVGDRVRLNQPLCTVETAKATVEIPSPFSGAVVERVGEPGETIPVGALLVRVAVAEPSEPAGATGPGRRTPTLVGYGPEEGPSRRRRRQPTTQAPAAEDVPPAVGASTRALAKPPVRKRARELGIDLASLAPGSGPHGEITRADVDRAASALAASSGPPKPSPPAQPSAGTPPGPPTEPAVVPTPSPAVHTVQPGDMIPVQGIRARIAEKMTRSRSTIPDASFSASVDCGRLLDARALIRDAAAARLGADVLTPFVLILRAVVLALQSRPILNSTFEEDDAGARIKVHDEIHLGFGVDTPRGLLVPVVRNAERLSTLDLAGEVRRLTEGARAGTLTPAELVGSTFTVSNFGVFGLDDGYPIINHPEVAILGMGAIRERPTVVDGGIVVRPTATFTCSFDHRVCDGADAGAFLGRVRELVEAPGELVL